MSRFGSTATISWNEGDTFTGSLTISLAEDAMPQYPVEEGRIEDTVMYRSKVGQKYTYQNYSKRTLLFNWSNLAEGTRDLLATMVNSVPIFSFSSGGNDVGTYRIDPESISDMETSYELYDYSFLAEEV